VGLIFQQDKLYMLSMYENVNVVCNDENVVCNENTVQNVDMQKTHIELFTCVGCPAEAKLFNPSIGKLDPKTVSCQFIGYPDKSKGFHFYRPNRYIKIVETRHIIFLEDEVIRGSTVP
jgi:hypothetical protein